MILGVGLHLGRSAASTSIKARIHVVRAATETSGKVGTEALLELAGCTVERASCVKHGPSMPYRQMKM